MVLCLAAIATSPRSTRPSATVLRVEKPPIVDGRLDEECWQHAVPIGPLVQVLPVEGARPSEDTDVRLLFDRDTLFVGIRCFDREPNEIIATQMRRDAPLDSDDRVVILLDTFLDRRNGFLFAMNPAGSKVDALVSSNGEDVNAEWDGIWEGKATIDDAGWSVEMAIPFKTLSFKPDLETWGFNVTRYVKRRNESDRWAGARADVQPSQISEAGDVHGFAAIHQGFGLDVVPFFVTKWSNDLSAESNNERLTGRPGFDAFYRITSNLTAAVTVNTDFAETEVDERQINLTRFPLFFPEKRDFFLQDAGIFGFSDLKENELIPFFSRRIGLTNDGKTIPILAGAKLTGRAEDWNIGLLDVETDTNGDTPERNLAVARVSRNVGEQSTIGGIVTRGNPSGTGENLLYGLDGNFRTSTFGEDKNFTASAFALQTYTSGESGSDLAYGASVGYPNDLWNWNLQFREIQSKFDPALGFVPRPGVREYTGQFMYRPRPHTSIRQITFAVEPELVTGIDNEIQTFAADVTIPAVTLESGDVARIGVGPEFERLDEPFAIFDDVVIPPGDYTFTPVFTQVQTTPKRPVSLDLIAETGEFWDGHHQSVATELSWRPSRYFNGSIAYDQDHATLHDGHFTTHLTIARTTVQFTPDLSWRTLVQFDNDSNSWGVNSLIRWILKPGQEIFLVFNETLQRANGATSPLFEEAAIKLQYTLRF